MLECQELDDIYRYMSLSLEIDCLTVKSKFYRWEFYQQSFHTGVVFSGYDIRSQAIKIDNSIIKLSELLDAIDEHIKMLKAKRKYWHSYLDSLEQSDQDYLIGKYSEMTIKKTNNLIDRKAIEEIQEIETAICFMFGYEETVLNQYEIKHGDFLGNMMRIIDKQAS